MSTTAIVGSLHWRTRRILERDNSKMFDGSTASRAVPPTPQHRYLPHLKDITNSPSIEDYWESIRLYIAGEEHHPLVRQFGWGERPKHVRA